MGFYAFYTGLHVRASSPEPASLRECLLDTNLLVADNYDDDYLVTQRAKLISSGAIQKHSINE